MGETIAQNRRATARVHGRGHLRGRDRAARHRDQEHPRPQGEPRGRLRAHRSRRGLDRRAPHRARGRTPTSASTTSRSASRKLLLHREEIDELLGKTKAKGLTLVPLRLYINDRGKAKVLLGLARGKQTWDRRREIAERDAGARPSAPWPTPGDAGGTSAMRLARMIQAVDAPRGGRARPGHRGRRARRPGGVDVREDAPPRRARRRAAHAHAPRASRLPGAMRERRPARRPIPTPTPAT